MFIVYGIIRVWDCLRKDFDDTKDISNAPTHSMMNAMAEESVTVTTALFRGTMRLAILSLCACSAGFLHISTSKAIDWQNPGPGGGGYLMSCVFQPDDENVIYIGSDVAGIHKSTNSGMTWTKMNVGLAASGLKADTYGVENILIDPFDYTTLYIAGWCGVFKSTNAAASWTQVLDKDASFGALAIDPADRNIVYAGVGEMDVDAGGKGEIYRSVDAGKTWTLISSGFHRKAVIYGIVIDPNSPTNSRTLVAGTGRGVYKSADGGKTWRKANKGLRSKRIRMMDSIYHNGSLTIYVLCKGGKVFKSADLGERWRKARKGLPRAPFTELRIHPDDPQTVYVALWQWTGTPLGVYRTTNAGQSWELLTDEETNMTYGWIRDWWGGEGGSYLAIAPSNPDIIVHGENGMYKTTNGGVTWASVYTTDMGGGKYRGHGLEPTYVYTVAFDSTDTNRYYIGYEDIGLWRTDDGGASYSQARSNDLTDDNNGVSSIVVDPDTPSTIYADCAPSGLAPDRKYPAKHGRLIKSTDYGKTWQRLRGLPRRPTRLVLDPSSPASSRVLYAVPYGRGIFRSDDAGNSWRRKSSGLGKSKKHIWALALDPNNSSVLYAGANSFDKGKGGLFKTADSGNSWQKLTGFPADDVVVIVADKDTPNTIYVGAQKPGWKAGGLYKTTDGGTSWTLALDKPYAFAAVIDPADSQTIYAAASQWWDVPANADHGLYRSADGGTSWEKIDTPPHLYVLFLGMNPLEPGFLYVGTHGGGLIKGKVDSK